MGWRIIQITKPCRLSIKNKQFVYAPIEGESVQVPLEDVAVIILESLQISLNSTLISELSEHNIIMFSCDFSHTPNGVHFPFHKHSRYSEVAWIQIETAETFKKKLWQEVIKSKIENQSECLELSGCQNSKKVKAISTQVQSGDSKNSEAFAAALYWKSLFENFNRNDEADIRNSALNYGYAIIRGCMARAVVGAGLIPCFGIHHCNKLNQFNLVDDLMEPFRPFVDFQIKQMDLENLKELNSQTKNKIISTITQNCIFDNEEQNLLKCFEFVATDVVKSMRNKNMKHLRLPKMKKITKID